MLSENPWIKSGDLTRTFNSGAELNRQCRYSNSSTDAIICELFIGGYLDGNYQISAQATSVAAFNLLKRAIISAGFPDDSARDLLKTVRVMSIDRDIFRHFLNAVKQVERSFIQIENEIVTALDLTNLNPVTRLPIWHKSGNLSRTLNYEVSCNRECTYSNTSPDAVISQLSIYGYRDEDYEFRVKAKSTAAYHLLKQAIIDAGLPAPDLTDETLERVKVVTSDRNRLRYFLNAVKSHERHFNLIEDEIISSVVFRAIEIPRQSIFRQANVTSTLPETTINQKKLDDGFCSKAELSEEEQKHHCNR